MQLNYTTISVLKYVFFRELQYPNIIPVMGHKRMKHGKLVIMMRFIDGPNLHDIILGGKPRYFSVTMTHSLDFLYLLVGSRDQDFYGITALSSNHVYAQ